MSRVRRAGIAASFGYLQFALAIVSGILLVPFILSRLGTETYGVWLGVGEMVAYAALVDMGVLNVLPWLVAERDGAGDREGIRDLIATGVVVAACAGLLFAAVGAGLFSLAPRLATLSPEVRDTLAGPLALTLAGVALAYPFRVFQGLLTGLQDVVFVGRMAVAVQIFNVALVVTLLLQGAGLYALAAAAAVPPVLSGLACLVRTRQVAGDLLHGWRRPSPAMARSLAAQGFGAWTASFGWRMVAATNTLVILSIAGPVPAALFALNARLGETAMQMTWQLPDAGLVGLAQMRGEGAPERTRRAALQIARLGMLGGAAAACAVLAFNGVFVRAWVGPTHFAGFTLTAVLAAVVVAHTVAHVLFTVGATLGGRVHAGAAAVLQGALQIGAALLLGRYMGLPGVALAAVIGVAVVAAPVGLGLLARHAGIGAGALWSEVMGPWLLRCGPLLLLGLAVGPALAEAGPWVALAAAPVLGAVFLVAVRPMLQSLPLPPRVRLALAQLRLVEG